MQNGNPMGLNFDRLEMQKRNIPIDRAQTVYEKNGVICLVIIFSPGVKIQKIAHFMYFLLTTAKNQS